MKVDRYARRVRALLDRLPHNDPIPVLRRRHASPLSNIRLLVYLLVTANLVFFSWHVLQNTPDAGKTRRPPPAAPNARVLATLEELRKQEVEYGIYENESLSLQKVPDAGPLEICYQLGPFPTPSKTKQVQRQLVKLGFEPKRRTASGRKEQVGYRVYLPAMEYEQAVEMKRILDRNDNEAHYIGEENVISLGTFSKRPLAERRQDQVRKLGLEPVLEPDYAARTVYWLDIKGVDVKSRMRRFLRTHQTVRLQARPCS